LAKVKLEVFYKISFDEKVEVKFIFPKSYFDVNHREKLQEFLITLDAETLGLFVKLQKTGLNSSGIKFRCLEDEKINVTCSAEDGYMGCIMLRKPHQKFSTKKLVIEDENVYEMLKEYILSLWEIAEEIDPKWINVLEEEVWKMKRGKV